MAAAFDRDGKAEEYARLHRETDPGVAGVYYLPTGAAPNEIRLVEVNEAITGTGGPAEPIDFGVDRGTPNFHRLVVLDVTPEDWEAILKGTLALPPGWELEGRREVPARRRGGRK